MEPKINVPQNWDLTWTPSNQPTRKHTYTSPSYNQACVQSTLSEHQQIINLLNQLLKRIEDLEEHQFRSNK